MPRKSNFPPAELDNLEPGTNAAVVSCLQELAAEGKPRDVNELKERIDGYFAFCADRDFRPGIESLALSLGVTRQGFWCWTKGQGVNEEWREVCLKAKQYILTFLEQISLTGRINPASSIFFLKNWAAYKDTISFDDSSPEQPEKRVLTAAELPKLKDFTELEGENERTD